MEGIYSKGVCLLHYMLVLECLWYMATTPSCTKTIYEHATCDILEDAHRGEFKCELLTMYMYRLCNKLGVEEEKEGSGTCTHEC